MPTASTSGAIPGSNNGRSTRAFGHLLTLAIFVTSAGAGLGEPERGDLESYAECAASAQTHVLDPGTARWCADAYLRIKLSFLPEIGPDQYQALPPHQRARANTADYAAYLDWKLPYVGSFAGPVIPADEKRARVAGSSMR